jgi:hypothetical protein
MRHSRISTTMDIYAQFVPESQRRALAKMSAMVESRTSKPVAANTGSIAVPPQSRMANYLVERIVEPNGAKPGGTMPLSACKKWWPGTELNRRRQPFQCYVVL